MSELKKGFQRIGETTEIAYKIARATMKNEEAQEVPCNENGYPAPWTKVSPEYQKAYEVSQFIQHGGEITGVSRSMETGVQIITSDGQEFAWGQNSCQDDASVNLDLNTVIDVQTSDSHTDVARAISMENQVIQRIEPLPTVPVKKAQRPQIDLCNGIIQIPSYGIAVWIQEVLENCSDDGAECGSIIYTMCVESSLGTRKVQVSGENLQDFSWLRKATGGLFPRDKETENYIISVIIAKMRTIRVEPIKKYETNGWRHLNGSWQYVLDHGAIGNENLGVRGNEQYLLSAHPDCLSESSLFQMMLGMINICNGPEYMWIIILYVLMSHMATLMEIAGFPLKFVLALVGDTNSRKTTLALLMGKIFNRHEAQPDVSFTATKGGIEKAAYEHKDSTVIIDDMQPGVTPSQERENTEKLEIIMRLYGDGTAKKRMVGVGSKGETKVSGGCILTGEHMNGSESSFARRIQLSFDRNVVQNGVLTYYQEHDAWLQYVYSFLLFVTRNSENVIKHFRLRIPELRKNGMSKLGRRNEQYAQFLAVAEVLIGHGKQCGAISSEDGKILYAQIQASVESIIRSNEAISQAVSPLHIVLKAFLDFIENSSAKIVPNGTFVEDMNMVCQDDEYWYVHPETLLTIVHDYIGKYKVPMVNLDASRLTKLLKEAALIKVASEGSLIRMKFHLPKYSSGKRYFCIRKDRLQIASREFDSTDLI